MTLTEYRALEQKVETARRAAEQAGWKHGELLEKLKENHKCRNLQQAEALLIELKREETELLHQLKIKMETYWKKWKPS